MSVWQSFMEMMHWDARRLESEIQHVVFSIYTEEYGIDICNILGVIRYAKPLKLPHTASYIDGVINFRGEVIVVLDLRTLFGLFGASHDENTAVLVVRHREKTFGLIVDRVLDVVTIPEEMIHPVTGLGAGGKNIYLKAMGEMEGKAIFLMDLTMLLEFQGMRETPGERWVS